MIRIRTKTLGDPHGFKRCACGAVGTVHLKGMWTCQPCIDKDRIALEMRQHPPTDPNRKYLSVYHVMT